MLVAALLRVSPAAVRLLNGMGTRAVGLILAPGAYNWVFPAAKLLQTPAPLNPAGHSSPKLPARSAWLSTITLWVDGLSMRWPSSSTKKKSRFLIIGPPKVPPKRLYRRAAFGVTGVVRPALH